MTTQLKKCTLEDLATLQQLSIETFTDTFGAYNTAKDLQDYLEQAYDSAKLTEELQQMDSEFYFLFFEEQLAGYLKINTETAQTESIAANALEVERIYIRTSFKRQGLGRYLLKQAIQLAKSKGNQTVWLGVWEHNEAAKAFYQVMGFAKVGAHSFYMGDDKQTDWIMTKNIEEESL